jgi:hypothetical protein
MANISTIVDFAGEMSKAASKEAKQKERLMEAMACSIEHIGLITFWAVNSQIMEAYTLWWNGGIVRSFCKTYSKVSSALENQYILSSP